MTKWEHHYPCRQDFQEKTDAYTTYVCHHKTTLQSWLGLNLCRKVRAGERGHYLHHRNVLVEHSEGESRGLPGLWEDWGELVHCVWHLREVQGVEQDKKKKMETFKVPHWEKHRDAVLSLKDGNIVGEETWLSLEAVFCNNASLQCLGGRIYYIYIHTLL